MTRICPSRTVRTWGYMYIYHSAEISVVSVRIVRSDITKNCVTGIINALLREIYLVGNQYIGKKMTSSLYFGGGIPALAVDCLEKIIDAVKEHFIITEGIGAELHPDDITPSVLQTLKDAARSLNK